MRCGPSERVNRVPTRVPGRRPDQIETRQTRNILIVASHSVLRPSEIEANRHATNVAVDGPWNPCKPNMPGRFAHVLEFGFLFVIGAWS